MGEDASEAFDAGDGGKPPDYRCHGALSSERRAAIVQQLNDLGKEVAGPNVAELVELVEQIAIQAHKPIPAVHASLADFVPSHARAAFNAEGQECRLALRKLIKEAKEASKLTKPSPELTSAEVDPFVCALMRLCKLPINGGAVEEVLAALQLLASLDTVLLDEEKPGARPIYNLCRASVRATYYYHSRHIPSLSVNFEYLDRTGVKPGARSRQGELVPLTPTARLACEVIKAFGIAGDAAEVQTHLRNYQRQLGKEGREPADQTSFWTSIEVTTALNH